MLRKDVEMIKIWQIAINKSATDTAPNTGTAKEHNVSELINPHHRYPNRYQRALYTICLLFLAVVALSGCSGLVSQKSGQHTVSSSLASFLYSGKDSNKVEKSGPALLELPIKVGIAFLPSQHWRSRSLDESTKYQLLNKVKQSFGKHPFIENISIIPSTYLKHHGVRKGQGFDTLQQVANIHDVDIIALVSYDQLTRSEQNNASLLYWTIVGMYVIPGNENTIQTFVDTAVFDVRSRKLLMRAPGVSKLAKRSTAIGVDSVVTQKSRQGFDMAFDDMIKNLDLELIRFKDRIKHDGWVKTNSGSVKITNQSAYWAAGFIDVKFSLLLILLFLLHIRTTSLGRGRGSRL